MCERLVLLLISLMDDKEVLRSLHILSLNIPIITFFFFLKFNYILVTQSEASGDQTLALMTWGFIFFPLFRLVVDVVVVVLVVSLHFSVHSLGFLLLLCAFGMV